MTVGPAMWWLVPVALATASALVPRRVLAPRAGERSTGHRRPARTDPGLLVALLGSAIGAGASVPRALHVVGRAIGGDDGDRLVRAGAMLDLGASWSQAWSAGPGAHLDLVAEALAGAWSAGAAPGPLLQVAAARWERERRARVRTAAGALGVRLLLPLGLCLLPSFVLLGLVPVVLSLAGNLLR